MGILLVCLVVAAMTASSSGGPMRPPNSNITLFERYMNSLWFMADYDRSGYFDRSEFDVLHRTYDVSGDRQIQKDEFLDVWHRNNPLANITMAEEMWIGFDVVRDNVWNGTDFTATYQLMDTNDDGLVNKAEFITYYKPFFQKMYYTTFLEERVVRPSKPRIYSDQVPSNPQR